MFVLHTNMVFVFSTCVWRFTRTTILDGVCAYEDVCSQLACGHVEIPRFTQARNIAWNFEYSHACTRIHAYTVCGKRKRRRKVCCLKLSVSDGAMHVCMSACMHAQFAAESHNNLHRKCTLPAFVSINSF